MLSESDYVQIRKEDIDFVREEGISLDSFSLYSCEYEKALERLNLSDVTDGFVFRELFMFMVLLMIKENKQYI